MTPMLSFENAPPLSVPVRFFASAPWYGVLAGLLVLVEGPDLLLSRWSPAVLALTHLLTVGLLLQVMLGALFQFLAVAADAGVARPRLAGRWVHGMLNIGALLLPLGFYLSQPILLKAAGVALALAVGGFVAAALPALLKKPHTSPSIPALKMALVGLAITLGFGLYLVAAYAFGWPGRAGGLTAQHVAWGIIGWSATLLVGIAYVVVPMFQLTPGYSKKLSNALVPALFGLLLAWSLVQAVGTTLGAALIGSALALTLGVFAAVTLGLQAKSRRAEPDTTAHYWRLAMFCTLLAATLWTALPLVDRLAADQLQARLVFALGTLALLGVLVSVISGMLYKILPFLCWLHLQQEGLAAGIAKTPHMGVFLAESAMRRQYFWHLAAVAGLLAGIALPVALKFAGAALTLSFGLLAANLLLALKSYRRERTKMLAGAAAKV